MDEGVPVRPDPPVVGKVTHSSVELIWDKTCLATSSFHCASQSIHSLHSGRPKVKYTVQEEQLGGLVTKGFGTVYGGYARSNQFTGLEPRTTYRYRVRAGNEFGDSEWSPCVEVTTTRKPPSSDDLHRAVRQNDPRKVLELLAELRKELIDAPDKFGSSPLMMAANHGFCEIAEILINHLADVQYQNSSGKNALMTACFQGNVELGKLLRRHGAKWESVDNNGAGPLHYAVDGGHADMVQWVLSDGCQVDSRDITSGWTPLLRLVSTHGGIQVARILIHYGADVNASDNDHKTVLMMAALNGHTSLVQLLISKGANPRSESSHSKTALDFARSFDHRPIVKILEEEAERMPAAAASISKRRANVAQMT